MRYPLTLTQLQRIKQWHVAHKDKHPLEYQIWDAMLCLWVMGWVGWPLVFVLDAQWACLLCVLAVYAPGIYVAWRARAHQARRLRCDWLPDGA